MGLPLPTPEHLPTPIVVDRLEHYLEGYDRKDFILDGLRHGFRLGSVGTVSNENVYNLKSAVDSPAVVKEKLDKEIKAGRLAGPFAKPPFESFAISPIGIVPKKEAGKFRLIHHLSHPKGESVNDSIPKENATVRYQSLDDAIRVITKLGPKTSMAKCDIESAFRLLPVSPMDYHLLGMYWDGEYYFDRCVAMGCASSCALFEIFATALHWIAQVKLGIPDIVHVLDDFLFLGPSLASTNCYLQRFIAFCDEVGIPLADNKTQAASSDITFLGLLLDAPCSMIRLPSEKLAKAKHSLSVTHAKTKVTLKELQQLLGFLQFCCRAISPGRAFLRRLIDLTRGLHQPYHRRRITTEARLDLLTWIEFLDQFNGTFFFPADAWQDTTVLHLVTDASSLGFAAILEPHWFAGVWPDEWKPPYRNITFLELYPIVAALHHWCATVARGMVLIHTDNEALVSVINKNTSKEPLVMKLVRQMVLCCMKHNIILRAVHIKGEKNVLADSLSRLRFQKFHQLAPHMDRNAATLHPEWEPNAWRG